MRYHVRGVTDARERVRQSEALMKFLADASAQDTIYGFELRNQYDRIKGLDAQVLYHDDLAEVAKPFYLHEIASEASRHGLQYMCDAAFSLSHLGRLPPKARERLAAIPETDPVTREQYMDFLEGRAFRESLLCHADTKLQRNLDPSRVNRFNLSTSAVHSEGPADPAASGIAKFKTDNGSTLATDHRLSRAVLRILGTCWPQSKGFVDVVKEALADLGAAAEPIRANLEDETEALAKLVFRAFSAGQFQLRFSPGHLTTTISERPMASLLARKQAETGRVVTNLLHRSVSMKDDTVRQFLILVDGTRTVDQLVSDLNAAVGHASEDDSMQAITREAVEDNLRLLAKLGLLVAGTV
jgi:methyltransferase-like protein